MWKRLIFLAPSFSSSMLWWPGFGGTLAYFHANSPEKMEPNNFFGDVGNCFPKRFVLRGSARKKQGNTDRRNPASVTSGWENA